jgi:hypothetical protein
MLKKVEKVVELGVYTAELAMNTKRGQKRELLAVSPGIDPGYGRLPQSK